MAASDRRQVQQDLKQPDPFFEAVLEAREYFDRNRSQVLAVGGGAALLIALVLGGTSWYASQGDRAATDFASAVSSLEFETPSAAEVALKDVAQRSNAGPYKALAALYQGNLAADAGRYEEAITNYDQFLASPPSDYLRQIGLMGKAAALERAGRAPEAATTLDLASAIDGPYRRAALSDRARIAEAAGDKATAVANLEKVLEIEGSGPGSAEIEQHIKALK
jgi:predicted negative regulator of RcsB-dependent stress response